MRKWTGIAAGALVLAACGESAGEDAAGEAEAPAAEGAAATDGATPAPEEGSEAAAPAGGDLMAYVGKFPAEAVNGVAWPDHPLVVAGLRKTLTDEAVRRAMQTPDGPTAPIATYQGKVGSWGCQPHNCGDHQWATLVDPRTGATDVCYHNAEQTGDASRWYLADGRQELRPGDCSVV